MPGVTEWLPTYHRGHRYEITLALDPVTALRHALGIPAAPDRLVRLLFRLRGLHPDGSIPEFFAANGFTVLEHTATSYVIGILVGYPPETTDIAGTWRTLVPRNSLRIAADFRTEPASGGARLIMETRVAAADRSALRRFVLYWLLVGPFSRLIRLRWLRAVAERLPTAA